MEEFEFPTTVDAVESVPQEFRTLYVKGADGKFGLHESLRKKTDNSGLVTALDKERKRAKELEKHVNGWKGLGLGEDFTAASEALKAAMGGDDEDGEDDEDDKANPKDKTKRRLSKIKADAQAAIDRQKTEYEQKLQSMQTSLNKHLIESQATAAIAELKGVPELLLPHVMKHCLLKEEAGVYTVQVVDAEGDPRGNGKGGVMTVQDLVAEMRASKVYGRAFEADGKAGSGTRPSTGTGGSRDGAPLTSIQKISKGLAQLKK